MKEACDIEIGISPPRTRDNTLVDPGARYRWTLDVAAYAYVDLPVEVDVEGP